MFTSGRRSLLACLMAVVLPVSLSAQTAGSSSGVLSPGGMVTVNGELVRDSAPLHGDETITTGPNSGARINTAGASAVLAPETTVKFTRGELTLIQGAISSSGMTLSVGGATFVPVPGERPAKFEIHLSGCHVTVEPTRGSVTLAGGQTISEGSSRTLAVEGCASQSNEEVATNKVPKPIMSKAFVLAHPIAMGVAGAAVAAGVTIAVVESGGGKKHVSPARP